MRLHSLRLTGIGPFKGAQEIDFDELSASGLFLIEGPTGSGKTTIIDAIVYALFGVVSAGSDDLTRMRIRSSYCDEADPSGVACEFSVDGRRHRIARVPAACRDPEDPTRKATSKGPRQVLVELGPDGEPVGSPLAVRKEVDARVEQLLGMTADQFRQLVVLPQGQFADLLRKTPAERLAALAPLLEDAFIAGVQEDLRHQGDLAAERRAEAERDVDRAAQRLAGRLKAERDQQADAPAIDFTDASADARSRREAVQALLGSVAEQVEAAAADRMAQQDRTDLLREASTASAGVLTLLCAADEARSRVDRARAGLDPQDAGLEDRQITAQISDLRRREGALEAHAAWESGAGQRSAERAVLGRARAEQAQRAEHLRVELADLPRQRADRERARDEAAALAALLPAREAAEAAVAALLDTARHLTEQRAILSAREAELATARAREKQAADAAEQSRQEWERLVFAHRSGTAGALAATLVPGRPCPVCGSCEHPHPMEPETGEVTGAQIDAAAAAAADARTAAAEAVELTTAAGARHAEAATAVATLTGALADRTPDNLAGDLRQASQSREASQSAARALPDLQAAVASLAERESAVNAGILSAETEVAAAAATYAAAQTAEDERRKQIAAIVGPDDTATTLLEQIRQRITALTELADAIADLALSVAQVPAEQRDLTVPQATERAQQDKQAHDDAAGTLTVLADRAAALAATHEEAAPLAASFIAALDEYEVVLTRTTVPLSLAALVTAGNSRRLQLRAYALQRRFESVLAAASIQLERMSSGKFSFVAVDEAARGQAGLGIQLLDAWTGHLQDPRSLSGGETFYASLALALGLAEVVMSEVGGAQLETLFVDEGFGSLDQDTLYQVLEQLDRLRAGNRAVGVVSHVTEMKESIPDRLEVRRLPDSTSTIARVT